MSVSLAILILYIVALFAISWFAKKRSEGTTENYALAGRKLNAPLIGVSIAGEMNTPDILLVPEIQQKGAEIIKNQNEKIAKILGINISSRTTCEKPN